MTGSREGGLVSIKAAFSFDYIHNNLCDKMYSLLLDFFVYFKVKKSFDVMYIFIVHDFLTLNLYANQYDL